MNYQPKADTEKKKYHQDLSQLADERMRYRQLNRLKDNQEGMLVGIHMVYLVFYVGNFSMVQPHALHL